MEADELTPDKLNRLFAPGRWLDVLLTGRTSFQEKAVRRARILGLQDGDLAMSLPEPPLPSPVLGRAVEITVVDSFGGKPRRYGYQTSVLDVVDDYPAPEGAARAVVVMFPRAGDIYPTSLRRSKRFPVPPDGFLVLAMEGEPRLRLLDISVKGLRFLHPDPNPRWDLEQEIRPLLLIDSLPYQLTGKVAGVNRVDEGLEYCMELGVLHLDAWTSLLVALHQLEHGPEGRKEGTH